MAAAASRRSVLGTLKEPLERMKKLRIVGAIAAALVIFAVAIGLALAWRPAIAAIDPPAPQSFDAALIKHGRDLAALGNCNDCHTVRGGRNFAGGLPVPTPFGTVFSSNITPDAETGIGRWSEEAFKRAMRSGVDREGRHLYPTFPYDHFTNVSDQDDHALYVTPIILPGRPCSAAMPVQATAACRRICSRASSRGCAMMPV